MCVLILLLASILSNLMAGKASTLLLNIYYPEDNIAKGDGYNETTQNIFVIGLSTMPYDVNSATEFYEIAPWFGNSSIIVSNRTDRVSPNNWLKIINLGEAVGRVYLNLGEYDFSLKFCTESYYAHARCHGKHSTYYFDVETVSSVANLTIYPNYYVFGQGRLQAPVLHNFYSPQLDNYRDISVYVPWSLIENPITRAVNILVQLDGDVETIPYYVFQGGFDSYVLSGAAPESIMIGIGTANNGSGCPDPSNGCLERNYEFSNVACNADGNLEAGYCPWANQAYGGLDAFLNFTWDTVIPAVLQNISMLRGEVSIFGESLGGYASCYAAASRPTQFKRALCISPSFWWNYGSLSTLIPQLHAQHNNESPKAVVMTLGTQESPQLYVPANYPNTSKDKITWAQFVAQVTAAFLSIGMGTTKQMNESSFPSADSNLVSIAYIGGEHNAMQWGDIFSYGLSLMYAPDYPDQTRLQRNQATVWNYPSLVVANSSTTSSSVCSCPVDTTDDYAQTLIVILSLLLAVATLLLVIAGGYIYFQLRDKQEKHPSFSDISSTLLNNYET